MEKYAMVREERSGATVVSALERLKWYFLFSSRLRLVGPRSGCRVDAVIGGVAENATSGIEES